MVSGLDSPGDISNVDFVLPVQASQVKTLLNVGFHVHFTL